MKVIVKRKSGAAAADRKLSGNNRWQNVRKTEAARTRNQRKVIRATQPHRYVRKGA